MKAYEVLYTDKAIKQLSRMDKQIRRMIKAWIEKNLVGTDDPRKTGKALTGDRKQYWRYRVGDYRILADINDDKLIILVVTAAHRREVCRS